MLTITLRNIEIIFSLYWHAFYSILAFRHSMGWLPENHRAGLKLLAEQDTTTYLVGQLYKSEYLSPSEVM